jgi:hypothetical protein
LHWVLGIRFAIACGVPAIIGIAAGRPLAGVIAGIGALFPMLADICGNMRERLTLMFATSPFMTAGLIAGAATSGHFWVSLLLIAVAAFAAAWVLDLHRVLDVTLRSSHSLVGSRSGVHDPIAAACFLAGGVFACLVVLLRHLIRQYDELQPLPTWSEGLRLLLSGQSIAGLQFALSYTGVAIVAVAATQALGVQRRLSGSLSPRCW